MSKLRQIGTWVGVALLLAVMTTGCGDDDKGHGGVGPDDTLTTEEQFDLFDEFVYVDTTGGSEADRDSLDMPGLTLLNMGIGMVHVDFMDGVTSELIPGLEIPGLPKRVPGGAGSATVSVNYVNGWWEIVIDSTLSDDNGTYTVHFEGHIRFEDYLGQPQESPGITTAKFIENAEVDATYNRTNEFGATSVHWDASSQAVFEINPLSASAELNTTSTGTLTAGYVGSNASFTYVLGVDGHADHVVVSLAGESICPDEGSVTIGFDMLYDATGPSGTDHVDSDWTVSAVIQEGGALLITVQSGDFTKIITSDIECGDSGQ